jgi:23S rRNA pseudouridine2605 synthase
VEALIREGKVTINGEVATDLGRPVDPATDQVSCGGRLITLPDTWRVFVFHKPRGVVSTLIPQDERPCLAKFRDDAALDISLIPVGRLDSESSGLLIWTDDGMLSQKLCKPVAKVWKVYEALLDAPLPARYLPDLRHGKIELDGRPCLPARLTAMDTKGLQWKISIHEGRNRQVRRMFEAIGWRVVKLHRVAYGPLQLADLPEGTFRELSPSEIELLRNAINEIDKSEA